MLRPPSATLFPYTTLFRSFRAGMPYRLHLENHGKETHEFTAPGFLQGAEIRNPTAVNADRTEILVQPGERSEEHTSELQSLRHLVCRLLLEKKKKTDIAQQCRTATQHNPSSRSQAKTPTQQITAPVRG